ncbi:MAG: carbohydrate binding domain-containing protein [Pseudomonadota bacterium]
MNQLKRKRPNFQWLLTCSMSALISISAQAGIVVPKPTPHGSTTMSPEMGHILTRVGNYTLAGTPLETIGISGEVIVAEPSQQQGVVYLFNGATATPERIYQFPGVAHTLEFAGFKVAMSNQWAAFASKVYYYSAAPSPVMSYVYIAGKTNGVWASCPIVNTVPNCNSSYRENNSSLSKPLTRIAFGDRGTERDDFDESRLTMEISDKYLVLADSKKSIVRFYRYDAASTNWVLEYDLDDDDYKTVGKAVAIYGDRIAVSQTWAGNPTVSNGKVRIYQRNANNGTWSMSSQVDGNFGTGNFGNNVRMDTNTLVVASGASGLNGSGTRQLVFFALNTIGNPTGESYVVTAPNLNKMSLSGNNLAVSNFVSHPAVTIYSRNTASSTLEWKPTAGLNGDFYNNLNRVTGGGALTGQDDVGLVGDDLSLGWRVFNPDQNGRFMGAVIHEKVSLLDTCRDPKNLVVNCSFDNANNTTFNGSASSANWTLLNHQGGSGTVSYTGRQLRVSISNPGSDMWHIQARTPVNLSQAVRYKLTFRAKADANRSFVVNIGHNGNQDNNWQSYGRENVYATTSWTDYSYEFQVPMDANAFLDFNLGNAGTSAVTIDGVSLKAF